MTEADWLALARGCCSRATAAESGCALCVGRYAAIDRLRAVVAAGDELRAAAQELRYSGVGCADSTGVTCAEFRAPIDNMCAPCQIRATADAYDRARRGGA